MAPPPSPPNAGLDAATAVPAVPLPAGLPKLSGTPVGGAPLFVVAVPVGPFGLVGVGLALEASAVTVGTVSVTPFSAQFCAKSVPKQIRRGQNKYHVEMSRGRTNEGGKKKIILNRIAILVCLEVH